jgi:hypothetical protein
MRRAELATVETGQACSDGGGGDRACDGEEEELGDVGPGAVAELDSIMLKFDPQGESSE